MCRANFLQRLCSEIGTYREGNFTRCWYSTWRICSIFRSCYMFSIAAVNCLILSLCVGWVLSNMYDTCHRICRSTASRSPVLTRGGICVPGTVTYLPYRVSGSTLTAVGRSQLLARWPGTLCRILSGFQRATQTVLGVCLKRTCYDTIRNAILTCARKPT